MLVSKSNHMVGAALQIVHVLGFILLLSALVHAEPANARDRC